MMSGMAAILDGVLGKKEQPTSNWHAPPSTLTGRNQCKSVLAVSQTVLTSYLLSLIFDRITCQQTIISLSYSSIASLSVPHTEMENPNPMSRPMEIYKAVEAALVNVIEARYEVNDPGGTKAETNRILEQASNTLHKVKADITAYVDLPLAPQAP